MIRRAAAAVSVLLLVALSISVAEGMLLLMLALFSSILRLELAVQIGDWVLAMQAPLVQEPSIEIRQAGTIGSILFTLACGGGAAAWRYRQWRPA